MSDSEWDALIDAEQLADTPAYIRIGLILIESWANRAHTPNEETK